MLHKWAGLFEEESSDYFYFSENIRYNNTIPNHPTPFAGMACFKIRRFRRQILACSNLVLAVRVLGKGTTCQYRKKQVLSLMRLLVAWGEHASDIESNCHISIWQMLRFFALKLGNICSFALRLTKDKLNICKPRKMPYMIYCATLTNNPINYDYKLNPVKVPQIVARNNKGKKNNGSTKDSLDPSRNFMIVWRKKLCNERNNIQSSIFKTSDTFLTHFFPSSAIFLHHSATIWETVPGQ